MPPRRAARTSTLAAADPLRASGSVDRPRGGGGGASFNPYFDYRDGGYSNSGEGTSGSRSRAPPPMAASAYPSGNQNGANAGPVAAQGRGGDDGAAAGGNPSNGAVAVRRGRGVKNNPGIPIVTEAWTANELAILEEGLRKYVAFPKANCFAKISMELMTKTVVEVAMRFKWMSKEESGKKMKADRSQPRKTEVTKPASLVAALSDAASPLTTSPMGTRLPGPSFGGPAPPSVNSWQEKVTDPSTDSSPYLSVRPEIGDFTVKLLEHNLQTLNQIYVNFSRFQLLDNINLLCEVRDNISIIMNECSISMPAEFMKCMPQLPVKLNDAFSSSFFPVYPSPHGECDGLQR